jgi:hypothetical protein
VRPFAAQGLVEALDDARLRLSEVAPRHVVKFMGWLCDEKEQGRRLSNRTVRNVFGPLRAYLAPRARKG